MSSFEFILRSDNVTVFFFWHGVSGNVTILIQTKSCGCTAFKIFNLIHLIKENVTRLYQSKVVIVDYAAFVNCCMKEISVNIQEKKVHYCWESDVYLTRLQSPSWYVSTKWCSFSPFSPTQCKSGISVNFAFTQASRFALFLEQFVFTASCFLQGITVTEEIFILASIGCNKTDELTSLSFSSLATKQSTHSKYTQGSETG